MVTSKLFTCRTGNSVSTFFFFFFLTTATFGLDWDWLVDSSIFTCSRQNSANAYPSSLPWLFSSLGTAVTEKAMAPHSSALAWKIPWMEEPGGLQSMGSLRVRHDWATSLSLFTFMLWRRKWQPTPVFLPGQSQGRGSLVGCCLWGRTESDMTEET